jgi:hypothetical protein
MSLSLNHITDGTGRYGEDRPQNGEKALCGYTAFYAFPPIWVRCAIIFGPILFALPGPYIIEKMP